MILSKDQIIFCRIKAKCFWPAQVKAIKKSGGVDLLFLNRPDLDIQQKPESDIVFFEEGIEKAKLSKQQGIEQAIDKANEIIQTQKKNKKLQMHAQSVENQSKIKIIINQKSLSKVQEDISKVNSTIASEKPRIPSPKQKMIEMPQQKERSAVAILKTPSELSSSKIREFPQASKTRSESILPNKKVESSIILQKKTIDKQPASNIDIGVKRKREISEQKEQIEPKLLKKLKELPEKENASQIIKHQKPNVDHSNKENFNKNSQASTENKHLESKVVLKKVEKIQQKSQEKQLKSSCDNGSPKNDIKGKSIEKLKMKKTEERELKETPRSKNDMKQKETINQDYTKKKKDVEKEKFVPEFEIKEEEIDHEEMRTTNQEDSYESKRSLRKEEQDYEYENENENEPRLPESPQFGPKSDNKQQQMDQGMYSNKMNSYQDNISNLSKSYERIIPSWSTSSYISNYTVNAHSNNNNSFSTPQLNDDTNNSHYSFNQFNSSTASFNTIFNNIFNNTSFQTLPQNKVYFEANDELNLVVMPIQEEKPLTSVEKQGLLYTGLKTGAITAQQYEFLTQKLKQQEQQQLNQQQQQQLSQQQQQQQQLNQQQQQQQLLNQQQQQQQQQQINQLQQQQLIQQQSQQLSQQQQSQLSQQINTATTTSRVPLNNITQSTKNTDQITPFSSEQQPPTFSYPKLSQSLIPPSRIGSSSVLSSLNKGTEVPSFSPYSINSPLSKEISQYLSNHSFNEQRQNFSPSQFTTSINSPAKSSLPSSPPSNQPQNFENCQIRQKLQCKILPMLENKVKNKVYYENEKDMWLCEIVDCVRQLKTIHASQIYEGEYSVILEQIYDWLLAIQEQTKRNFQYVLNMIQRTMADLDKKVIKYLHDPTSSQQSPIVTFKPPILTPKVEDNSSMRFINSSPQKKEQQIIPQQISHLQQQQTTSEQIQREASDQERMPLSPPSVRVLKFQEAESTSKKFPNSDVEVNVIDTKNQSPSSTVQLITGQQKGYQKPDQVKEEFQV